MQATLAALSDLLKEIYAEGVNDGPYAPYLETELTHSDRFLPRIQQALAPLLEENRWLRCELASFARRTQSGEACTLCGGPTFESDIVGNTYLCNACAPGPKDAEIEALQQELRHAYEDRDRALKLLDQAQPTDGNREGLIHALSIIKCTTDRLIRDLAKPTH